MFKPETFGPSLERIFEKFAKLNCFVECLAIFFKEKQKLYRMIFLSNIF